MCLVINLHTGPKLAENDTIFPVTFASSLAETKKLIFSRCYINVKRSNLLFCNSKVPLTIFHLNPNQSKLWTGAHEHFIFLVNNKSCLNKCIFNRI